MPAIRDLDTDPDFKALSPDAKRLVFDQIAEQDTDYRGLSPQAQAMVRNQILAPAGESFLTRAAARMKEIAGTASPAAVGRGLLSGARFITSVGRGEPIGEASQRFGTEALEGGMGLLGIINLPLTPAEGLAGAATERVLGYERATRPLVTVPMPGTSVSLPISPRDLAETAAAAGVSTAVARHTFPSSPLRPAPVEPVPVTSPRPQLALPPRTGPTIVGPPRRFEAGPIPSGEIIEMTPVPPSTAPAQPLSTSELLARIEASRRDLTPREGIMRTLEAALDITAGKSPLDLGSVGRQRAAEQGRYQPPETPAPSGPYVVQPTEQTPSKRFVPRLEETVREIPGAPPTRSRLVAPEPTPQQAATGITDETASAIRTGRAYATPGAGTGTPLVDPILRLPIHHRVVQAAEDVFASGGVQRDPTRLISDQILDLFTSGQVRVADLEPTLQRHGLTFAEFGQQLFRPGVTDAARRLQALSAIERRLNAIAANPDAAQEIDGLLSVARTVDEGAVAQSWWRRADNIRRGLLITQLATAARNFETQVGRVGLDVLESGIDAGLQRVFRPGEAVAKVQPLDGLERALNIFRRGTKDDVQAILSQFPRENDRLFSRYASDIAAAAQRGDVQLSGQDRLFRPMERAVDVLNVFNRGQEYLVRRGVFQATLDQQLRAKGQNLVQLIEQGRTGTIDPADIRVAVDKALEMTFAEQPAWGSVGQKFVSFVNAMPGATLAIPFPRFMVNSLKFFYDYSPAGMLKLLSPSERAAIAAGDTETLSRALLGTGMLGAAYAFRSSPYAGEKWYEARLPDGRTIDMRPFNPFASYLFVADLAKRKLEGRLDTLTAKDLAAGVLGVSARAGTGLYLLDRVLDGVTSGGDTEKALEMLKGLAGETAAGFLVPLQQITDVMAQFSDYTKGVPATQGLGVVREKRTEPFLGPIKAQIPGLAQTLPEAEIPTRAGPIERQAPMLRQMTGLSISAPKNPVETEIDRLGLSRRDVLPPSGDPNADLLIAKYMGPMVEQRLAPVMRSEGYRTRMTDDQRALALTGLLGRIREEATRQAQQENPRLFLRLRYERIPRRIRGALEEQGVTPPAR